MDIRENIRMVKKLVNESSPDNLAEPLNKLA